MKTEPQILSSTLQAGRHEPLGSSVRDGGVNIAVFSAHAERIEFCVFDAMGQRQLRRYALHGPVDGVFHGFLPGAGPGLVYGLRAHGPHAPEQGHRFNAHKLLLDPYAREIVGQFEWRPEHHGYELGHPDGPRSFDASDNAVHALKARVAAPLAGPSPRASAPRHAVDELLIYEVHVKGFSIQHPDIPEALRGSYAALAHPDAIAHFKQLGVTTLELLPVHYAVDEPHLAGKGLRNYWGYNTLGFFAPDPRLASAAARHDPARVAEEFRAMVEALHAAGLEVVLDVVYNHTPEGNEYGPTLSWRGLDNRSWYRAVPDDRARAENLTGCGNTLNVEHPRVAQFVLDSLRYWVEVMGVDGFRFDLAPVLGRTAQGFDPHAAFFTALRQDPVLSGVHLIAEPWDAGPQGYQLGRFPGRFMEWNDRFRDAVRGYWLGELAARRDLGRAIGRGELARCVAASSDCFHHAQRAPWASINFIAVHDGYTLADMVSFEGKHNRANGEDNRDGRDNELRANFGVEGASLDPAVLDARERVRRAMLATLMLAQGTPMLNAGDEIGNSQGGNNNAYCQDNPTGWLSWTTEPLGLREFVARLARLRREHALLRHGRWFVAPGQGGEADVQLRWIHPGGHEMGLQDWHHEGESTLGCVLQRAGAVGSGKGCGEGERLALLFNPAPQPQSFSCPAGPWRLLLDSSGETAAPSPDAVLPQTLNLPARSLVLLQSN